MEHKSITMEDFLLKGEETLKIIQEQARVATKATKFNQWLFAGILSIMLIIIVDTRIDVVKKVDASEVQQEYVTKVDALNIHKLEESYKDFYITKYAVEYTELDLEWSIPFSILFLEQEYIKEESYFVKGEIDNLASTYETIHAEKNLKQAEKISAKELKQQKIDNLNKEFNENYK